MAEVRAKRPRDIRLDFFRGVCLVIIFISHVWANPWADWIPAKFGFSDATEIFVFCSGMASALAFGSVFVKRGLLLGAARIAFRCWQVYWAHIGTFIAAAVAMIAVDALLGTGSMYVDGLELGPLFDGRAKSALLGLLTLRYVPHYFDILPMYLVILAAVPLVMALAARDKRLVAALVAVCWLAANFGLIDLPAEPWGDRGWYFDPFGWQLVFFTGFALMSGWLPAPPVDARLLRAAIAVLVLSVPLSWPVLIDRVETLRNAREALGPLIDKSHFGIIRYVHFLSLAYVAYVVAGERGANLKGRVVEIMRRLGQQSLAVFMSGLVLSFLAAAVLNVLGRDVVTVPLVNLAGIGILLGIARAVSWFKSAPWQGEHRHTIAKSAASANNIPRPEQAGSASVTIYPAE